MKRDEIIAVLREHQPALHERGVLHAALFGSVARDGARPESDIDIMVELRPDMTVGVYGYVGIQHYLADLFRVTVDLANRSTLKSHVRPSAEHDAVGAF